MNRKHLIAAAVLAAAGVSAFAQEAQGFESFANQPVVASSSLSRADVRAELKELQQAGAWQPSGEASVDPLQAAANDAKIAQLPENMQQVAATENVPMDALDPLRSEDELMAIVWANEHEATPAAYDTAVVVLVPYDDAVEAVAPEDADVNADAPQMADIFQHPAIAADSR